MLISQIQRMQSPLVGGSDVGPALPTPRPQLEGGTSGFGETLKAAIEEVDGAQKAANTQLTSFISGEQENVHEVMIAMNEARVSFNLMTEVRNKLLETYQELMRMQV